MIRRAFTLKLKPGALPEYKRHHDNIWPDLVAAIESAGIARIHSFRTDGDSPQLFLYSEITDEGAWDRFWSSEPYSRWSKIMEPLMAYKDGKLDAGPLTGLFNLETGAAARKAQG